MRKIALLTILILLLNTYSTNAHTVLVSTSPKANSTISSLPNKVKLIFADNLLNLKGKINELEVVSPNGITKTLISKVKDNQLEGNWNKALNSKGKYQIKYRVAAPDGHIVSGVITFYLK